METRQLIQRHARALFLHRGFADVSVGEIAEAVGVTKPTLYYHFGNKEALYTAVLCDLLREVGGYVQRIVRLEQPIRVRLTELATGYFAHADTTMEPVLRDANELIGPAMAAEVYRIYHEEMLAPIETLMEEGIRQGEIRALEPEHLVRALMGLLDAFSPAGGHRSRTPAQHHAMAAMLVSLFLDGAAPR
ncbi:MAG TPA: TetR/AcrR family transcriptional regulator [Ktedonobacterales bacterium]